MTLTLERKTRIGNKVAQLLISEGLAIEEAREVLIELVAAMIASQYDNIDEAIAILRRDYGVAVKMTKGTLQ